MTVPKNYIHLIGRNVDAALAWVRNAKGEGFFVESLPKGTITTLEFDPKRVRVWYDPETGRATSVTEG